jgi:hypothetical protein
MLRLIFALLVAIAAIPASIAATPALAQFDGRWSVSIVTDRGNCDRAYRYGLEIRNGVVSYVGDNAFDIHGQVNRNGYVHVRVARGATYADGHGRLSRDGGSGVWQGEGSGSCSGTWTAERRPAG